MSVDFSSIRNCRERAVFDAVLQASPRYPAVAQDKDLLADVACVALNQLPPRYIRHEVDFAFYQTDRERVQTARQLAEAVDHAFAFVQARAAMRTRA